MSDHTDNPTGNSPRKPSNIDEGQRGENLAVEFLVAKGYAIREQNWRSGHYEIDIIAQHHNRMVFVEVKTRAGKSVDPVMAVNSNKQRRLIAAADMYLRINKIPLEYQFDIVSITGYGKSTQIEHIPDAFFPSPR